MFGSGLKKALASKGYTAYRLSKESGIDQAIISRIISGETQMPYIKTLKKICKVLNCEIKDLI